MQNTVNYKKKRKNTSKTHINEKISFKSNSYMFHLNNSDYFLAMSDLSCANGIDIAKNILIFSKKLEKKYDSIQTAISSMKDKKKLIGSYIAQKDWENIDFHIESSNKIQIISFLNTNFKLENVSNNLLMNKSAKGSFNGKIDLGQIIIIDAVLSPKDLIKYYKIAIETKIKYFEYLKLPEHIQNIVNNKEFLVVSSIIPEMQIYEKDINLSYIFSDDFGEIPLEENDSLENNLYPDEDEIEKDSLDNNLYPDEDEIEKDSLENNLYPDEDEIEKDSLENNLYPDEDEIEKDLLKTIIQSCNNSLKSANISFGILDYMKAEGVSIEDLVDAGMELLVEAKDSQRLRKKLKKQLLKSLEDLNVIALIMSAIRCEDDFQRNRLREVDVSGDPAYLYTDEVLGIAIANQIAGTKATFNFKRYDEEKPGIIAKLGPMVDDIFAGLVAGCMSKIFEDDD
ncbi:MAG: phosphatidylglycerophosphatase A [Methanobrevibacter sp.]|nr:phosphatidylglycerophosphatase A [Methanobrevibacter sp.]